MTRDELAEFRKRVETLECEQFYPNTTRLARLAIAEIERTAAFDDLLAAMNEISIQCGEDASWVDVAKVRKIAVDAIEKARGGKS